MKIWGIGQISPAEKQDILSKHKELYDGYRTMYPNVSNTQPLYVQDFANDKNGLVVNNKGEVKQYTNVGINEQVEESKHECSECGGMMQEGECTECGWKGEVGAMEEETGHLDDIYNVNDLGDNDFDYVEGGGNKFGTFEKMHHMKKIKSESKYEDPDNEDDGFEDIQSSELDELGTHELSKGKKYKLKSPGFEDDVEFEDEVDDVSGGKKMFKFKGKKVSSHLLPDKYVEDFLDKIEDELDEQGYTGGGNAPDNSKSLIKPAYDFISDGPGDVYPTESEMKEYETMESAWSDEELDEMNDISGVQGVYGDMKPAYDFDSKGPGSAGPYQRSSWGGGATDKSLEEQGYEGEDEDVYWEKDIEDGELDLDLTKFNPEDKSWEEITAHTGEDEFSHLDEDIKESFITQKNKINEMFNRMKIFK